MLKKIIKARFRNLIKRPFYFIYEKRLAAKMHKWKLPEHIGIILDGNRRWAQNKGLMKAIDGHRRGADKLHEVLNWCYDSGIKVVTIWIFSTENFKRSKDEVDGLMSLIEKKVKDLTDDEETHQKEIGIRFIGRRELLPESLQQSIETCEKATADYSRIQLNVAIAYGGREEIVDSVKQFIRDKIAADHSLEETLDELEPDSINDYLYTSGMPDPDLIIRTSGEVRLSGFLLWQSAYSEYYFCDTFWPEFRYIDFLRAMRSYHVRQRRFGK